MSSSVRRYINDTRRRSAEEEKCAPMETEDHDCSAGSGSSVASSLALNVSDGDFLDTGLLKDAILYFIKKSNCENKEERIYNLVLSYLRGNSTKCETDPLRFLIVDGEPMITPVSWCESRIWVIFDFICSHYELNEGAQKDVFMWKKLLEAGLNFNPTPNTDLELRKYLCGILLRFLQKRHDPKVSMSGIQKQLVVANKKYASMWKSHNISKYRSIIRKFFGIVKNTSSPSHNRIISHEHE